MPVVRHSPKVADPQQQTGCQMTDLTFYHAIPSRGFIVRWMLEELGEPYDIHLLDLDAQDHKKPDYLAVNPMGRVPALRHGDKVVTETAAICAYLAETFPKAGLSVPVGSPLRADYLRWMFFAPVTAEPAVLWRVLGKVETEVEYRPFATVKDVAETLRAAVTEREFIVGHTFTAADVIVGSTIWWGLELMPVLPRHPELVRYWQGLEKRPAWQRAQAGDEEDRAGPGEAEGDKK